MCSCAAHLQAGVFDRYNQLYDQRMAPDNSVSPKPPGTAAAAGAVNFLFSRDPRYVNDGCCGPRSRSAAKAAVGIKTRRLPPDLALVGGPDPAAVDPAVVAVSEADEVGGLSLWGTLVEIQTVMSIPSFLIIIVQVRGIALAGPALEFATFAVLTLPTHS